MNGAEQLVEAYFRICKKCFTMADVEVLGGNGRQLDLLAIDLKNKMGYHVETTVSHREYTGKPGEDLQHIIRRKFCGEPTERDGPNTDKARNKSYCDKISETYGRFGLVPDEVRRVVCTWNVEGGASYLSSFPFTIELLDFRKEVVVSLLTHLGTRNYDSPVLRAASLVYEALKQGNGIF